MIELKAGITLAALAIGTVGGGGAFALKYENRITLLEANTIHIAKSLDEIKALVTDIHKNQNKE